MIPARYSSSLLSAILVLAPAIASAQGQSQGTLDAERERQIAMQQQAIREKSIKEMGTFLNDTSRPRVTLPNPDTEIQARFVAFQKAIPKFREATTEYGIAVGMNSNLKTPLKTIESQTDTMLRYFERLKMKHPPADSSEFKNYSRTQLAWETLNSAEIISKYLDLAVEVERRDVLEPQMLEFMYALNGALLRLKWLATHIQN